MLSPWPRTLESFALHAVARHAIAPTMKSHRICMAETLDRDRQSANNTLGFLMGEQPNDGTTERRNDGNPDCQEKRGRTRTLRGRTRRTSETPTRSGARRDVPSFATVARDAG